MTAWSDKHLDWPVTTDRLKWQASRLTSDHWPLTCLTRFLHLMSWQLQIQTLPTAKQRLINIYKTLKLFMLLVLLLLLLPLLLSAVCEAINTGHMSSMLGGTKTNHRETRGNWQWTATWSSSVPINQCCQRLVLSVVGTALATFSVLGGLN